MLRNPRNLTGLLDERIIPVLPQILFTPSGAHGYCLFEGIVNAGHANDLNGILHKSGRWKEIDRKELQRDISLLGLCWTEMIDAHPSKKTNELNLKITQVTRDPIILKQLLSTPQGIQFFSRHLVKFATDSSKKTMHQSDEHGISPFSRLLETEQGITLFCDHFKTFKAYSWLSKISMHRAITAGNLQGMTPLLWLAFQNKGRQVFYSYFRELFEHHILTVPSFEQPVIPDGRNLAMLLFNHEDGPIIICQYFDILMSKNIITREILHQPMIVGGENTGESALYHLTKSKLGIQLIRANFKFFVENGFLEMNALSEIERGDGQNQGKSTLYQLVASGLMVDKWDMFRDNRLFSKESLCQTVTGSGQFSGMSALYVLLSYPSLLRDSELALTIYQDLLRLDLVTSEALYRRVSADGPFKSTFPFLLWIVPAHGLQFIMENWKVFLDKKLINVDEMSKVIDANGPYQGDTVGLMLYRIIFDLPEGKKFIEENMVDFVKLKICYLVPSPTAQDAQTSEPALRVQAVSVSAGSMFTNALLPSTNIRAPQRMKL